MARQRHIRLNKNGAGAAAPGRIPVLSDQEQVRLVRLGRELLLNLGCDANGTGLPCRTDRLAAVKKMREYVAIHDS